MVTFILGALFTLFYLVFFSLYAWTEIFRQNVFWQLFAITTIIVFVYIFVIKTWRFIYCLISRILFIQKIQILSKKNCWKYSILHSPIVPFFKSYTGPDITISNDQRTIHLKFFPYHPYKKIVHIESRDKITFSKQWALFYVKRKTFGLPGSPHTAEFFKRTRKTKFSFGNISGTCIWIIPKKCFRISCVNQAGNKIEIIDNGYVYFDNEIFYEKRPILSHLTEFIN